MARIDPVNCCIYCGETNIAKLTDEHIIPFSLNSNDYLVKASCYECNKSTHSFEGHVTGTMWGLMRQSQGAQSRRKKPSVLTIWGEYEDRCEAIEISARDHPGVFPVVHFDGLPSFLTRHHPEEVGGQVRWTGFDHANLKSAYPGVRSGTGRYR